MLHRIFIVLVVVPVAVALIALSVANRVPVIFTVDPFNPGNPALSIEVPLFVLLLAVLALGLVVGSTITWIKQRKYRKRLREQESRTERATVGPGTALSGSRG